jgi:hypothetical protein
MKTLYKVLNKDKCSPFQDFKYRIGEKYHCKDFDTDKNIQCSNGFYATDIDGLIYSFRLNRKVFSCEVWGKEIEIDEFKRRYENIRIIKEIPHSDIKQMALKIEDKIGYRLSEALFPVYPFEIDYNKVTKKDIELLKKWVSVWASVEDSVGASVWDSVWDSVGNSVRDSVGDSVRASVWAYYSSLFFNINQWKYIKHRKGVNPFQSCIDLWHKGLVPSYDGRTWRLHGGKDGKIVYEMI